MLIGIDASRSTAAQRTGTENYTLYLIRGLLKLRSAHTYRLYFKEAPPPDLFISGAPGNVQQRILPFPRLWTHIRLAWEVGRDPPDVLFVPAHVLPLIHPRRSVATVHDLGYMHYPQEHPRLARWYLDWATRFNAREARRVIVDSMATRDDLITCYGTAPHRIVVAYPAGAANLETVSDPLVLSEVQRRHGTGSCYFLYLGTLQPRKNLGALIRAFGTLVRRGLVARDVKLVLAGKPGWQYDRIAVEARDPVLRERIVLPGYVPTEDVAALLSGALAFVLPSWYEGFGLPVLEAMACNTPVICSNVSSLPEVAGDAALLFDPRDTEALADALLLLYQDPALRRDMARRGGERLRAFSWERCASTVLQAIEFVGSAVDDGV